MAENSPSTLKKTDLTADAALFGGQVQGLYILCYENEKPPRKLAGLMDWRMKGEYSRLLRAGSITGASGEVCYVPFRQNRNVYHLVFLGAGTARTVGERAGVGAEVLKVLQRTHSRLGLTRMALSLEDFGLEEPDSLARYLKGEALWITP